MINWKHKRSGHLFQDRFKSEPINDDRQFVDVIRYIYQNPVKAKICERPEEYRWSSCRFLGSSDPLVDTSEINKIIPIDQLLMLINEPMDESFIDIMPETRLTDEEAIELLKELSGIGDASKFLTLQLDKQERLIITMHEKGCSIRQLARITGITKAKIERMLS